VVVGGVLVGAAPLVSEFCIGEADLEFVSGISNFCDAFWSLASVTSTLRVDFGLGAWGSVSIIQPSSDTLLLMGVKSFSLDVME